VLLKIKKIKEQKDNETKSNYRRILSAKGKSVAYGQEIFLMHLDSEQFLNGLVKAMTIFLIYSRFHARNLINLLTDSSCRLISIRA
jgi:hypothetical protein